MAVPRCKVNGTSVPLLDVELALYLLEDHQTIPRLRRLASLRRRRPPSQKAKGNR